MSKDTFFITTAIDYTNGPPHIGHAYEKLLADVITRYRRARGEKAYFLTGVDQHGQKVQQSAGKEGVEPQEFADRIAGLFVDLWERMDVRYDGWASTTHPHHKAVVQTALQKLHDEGQLYKAAHTGFYSIRQEQFLTDKDRNEDGQFGPEWGEVQELQEENWYFKLQEHIPWLKDFILSHPDFIFPAFRAKEVLNALENSDSDLCISRPKTRLSWGIEFPFDPDYVTFVWFDALTNYISFAGYLADDVGAQGLEAPDFSKLWPADIHLIGK
ncbi:MAG: class I tRNA ligase family protein, partial [Verrucomicrobiota bacterium]